MLSRGLSRGTGSSISGFVMLLLLLRVASVGRLPPPRS
jgi:hypothetical protein